MVECWLDLCQGNPWVQLLVTQGEKKKEKEFEGEKEKKEEENKDEEEK